MSLLVYTTPYTVDVDRSKDQEKAKPDFESRYLASSISYIIKNLHLNLKDGIEMEEADFLSFMKTLLAWRELVDSINHTFPARYAEAMLRIYSLQKWFDIPLSELKEYLETNKAFRRFAIGNQPSIPNYEDIKTFNQLIESLKKDTVKNNIYFEKSDLGNASFAKILYFLCDLRIMLENNDHWLRVLLYFYLRFYGVPFRNASAINRDHPKIPTELIDIHEKIKEIFDKFFESIPSDKEINYKKIIYTLMALFAVFLAKNPEDENNFFVEYIGLHRTNDLSEKEKSEAQLPGRSKNQRSYHYPFSYNELLQYMVNERNRLVNERYIRETYRLIQITKHRTGKLQSALLTPTEIAKIGIEEIQISIDSDMKDLLPRLKHYYDGDRNKDDKNKDNKNKSDKSKDHEEDDERMYGSIYGLVNEVNKPRKKAVD